MLALAALYEDLLREEGIDPETVSDLTVVKENGNHLGNLKVSFTPKTRYIPIEVQKAT
jgi:hypothetical protein